MKTSPWSRLLRSGCLLTLTVSGFACTDNRRLESELKELRTNEIELNTETEALGAAVGESTRKLKETEKTLRGEEQEMANLTRKVDRLKSRLDYLKAATKAANEQSDALNSDVTKYRINYLTKKAPETN